MVIVVFAGACSVFAETGIQQRDAFLKACNPSSIKVAASLEDPGVDSTTKVLIFKKVSVHQLPAWVSRCTGIEMLRFLGGQVALSQENATVISRLEKLRFLSFDATLTEMPKDWRGLAALKNLQVLSFTNAGLDFVPDGIGEMTSIKSLYLNMNRLTTLSPELARLTALRELSLSDNHIASISDVLKKMKVEDIDLSGNDLSAISREQLPSGLKTLSLSRNKLGQFLEGVALLESLEELYLNDNYFDEAPPELLQCKVLKRVHLSRYVRVPELTETSRQLEIVKLDP
jgi:Leucine-rich repeat (LRR) protein